MESQEIKPIKKLGQVFLKNKVFIKKIINHLEIKPQETIIEIGPGSGILTEELIKTKANILAIEKDKRFVQFLKEKFKNYSNLKIIESDIRNYLKNESNLKAFKDNYKLVGNIPYYLTNYLFRLLIDLNYKPKITVLMVQKEVALRILAKPPKMSQLGIIIESFFNPQLICFVSKKHFFPQPKVDSAIIKLNLKEDIFLDKKNKEKFIKLIKIGFSQPRKLLLNNFIQSLPLKKEIIVKIFEKLNLNFSLRAENLKLEDWFSLFKELNHYLF